jgi:DNA mismatch repair ATPase MutL
MDAKPTSRIEVRLGNSGLDSFEVVDDGCGIPEQDRASGTFFLEVMLCMRKW